MLCVVVSISTLLSVSIVSKADYSYHETVLKGPLTEADRLSVESTEFEYTLLSDTFRFDQILYAGNTYLIHCQLEVEDLTDPYVPSSYRKDEQFFLLYGGKKYYLNEGAYITGIVVEGVSHDTFSIGVEVNGSIRSGEYLYCDDNGVDYYRANWAAPHYSIKVHVNTYFMSNNANIVSGIVQGNTLQQQGNELQQQENTLQQQQNTLQQEQNVLQGTANELQKQANETQEKISTSISDFFGSFFENIINAFKGLFIPEDGYFSDFFTRLNNFFSEKLGVLYAPIDIFVDIMTGIANANGVDAGIPFPGVSWEGVWIIEPQTISLSTYADTFPELQEKIYFVTNLIMVGSVIWLLQVKLKEVMRN